MWRRYLHQLPFYGRLIVFLIFIFPLSEESYSQNDNLKKTNVSQKLNDLPLSEQLPPLDRLIEIALENSPVIKSETAALRSQELSTKLEKRSWQRNISGFYNYARGSQQFTFPGMAASGEGNNMLNGYRYGVNFSIPLTEFTTRRTRVKISELGIESAKNRRDLMEMEISRQVTAEYMNLITAQKMLSIRSQGRENAQLVYQLGEKQFKEGTLGLEEYSRVNDSMIHAEAAFEMAIKEYNTMYRQFEELLGVSLTSIMRKK